MSQPKYLTGDKAAIEEFLEKFDVRLNPAIAQPHQGTPLIGSYNRSFSLIVMVCDHHIAVYRGKFS